MVATLLRLRFRILINTLTREVWRLVFTIIGVLYVLGLIAVFAVGAFFLGASGVDLAAPTIAAGVGLTLVWVLVPLLAFGLDDTLDPARFALFTTPTPAFGAGLILAGGVTLPGLLTLGGLLALTLAWVSTPLALLGWVFAAVVGFATCLTLARLVTTAFATGLRSRRGKDAAAGVGIVLLLALILVPNLIGSADVLGAWQAAQGTLQVLAWTPLGAPWAVPGAFAAGSFGLGLAHGVAALAWLGGLLLLWVRILGPAMTMPREATARVRRGSGGLGLAERIHRIFHLPLPAAAVAARALRYWRSDPRYFTQALTISLIAPLLAVVFSLTGEFPTGVILAMPLLMAFFAGWAIHNDTAYDSTALWLMIAAGMRGRDDRIGRAFAFLAWSLPALAIVTTAIIAVTGEWHLAVPLFAMVLGVFGAGVGFSLAISGYAVYPVQPPGTSPFSTTGTGAFGYTILIQTIAAIACVGLALPTIVTGLLGIFLAPGWGWVSLVVALGTLVGCLWAGTHLGGSYLDARAPRHLAAIRGWTGH